eukprot:jgi/Galph1/2706/GphlegSOOS_G1366.1
MDYDNSKSYSKKLDTLRNNTNQSEPESSVSGVSGISDSGNSEKSILSISSSQIGQPNTFRTPPEVITPKNKKDYRKVSFRKKFPLPGVSSETWAEDEQGMAQRNERTHLLEKSSLGQRMTSLVKGLFHRREYNAAEELRSGRSFDSLSYTTNGQQSQGFGSKSKLTDADVDMKNTGEHDEDDNVTIEEYGEFEVRQGPQEEHAIQEEPLGRTQLVKHLIGDIANMLKAFIGLNFLYVSYAFAHAGLIRGIIGLILISLITEHCCLLLVQVKNQMPEADDPSFRLTYGDLGRYVLGGLGEKLVNGALILTQFGYCTGYLIFLGQTLHDLFGASVSPSVFVLIPLPILIPLAMLRSLRSLAPFSLAANFSLLVGFVAVISYIGSHFRWQPSSPSITQLPVFFGQITSALEGIGLVVPVEQSMKSRKHFKVVIEVAIGMLSGVLLVVGALGFVTFGENTRSIIGNSPVVGVVKIVLCVGILFTYPLQLVPIVQAAEDWLAGRTISSSHGEALDEYEEEEVNEETVSSGSEDENEDESSKDMEADDIPKEFDITEEENYYQREGMEDASDYEEEGSEPDWVTNDVLNERRRGLFERHPSNVVARLVIVFGTAATAAIAGSSFGLFQALRILIRKSVGAASLAYIFPSLFHLKLFRAQLSFGEKLKNIMILSFGVFPKIGFHNSKMED